MWPAIAFSVLISSLILLFADIPYFLEMRKHRREILKYSAKTREKLDNLKSVLSVDTREEVIYILACLAEDMEKKGDLVEQVNTDFSSSLENYNVLYK